jgi:hypothetical protein
MVQAAYVALTPPEKEKLNDGIDKLDELDPKII